VKVCAEPGCPVLIDRGSRCVAHGGGTTTQRGYGHEHQRTRSLLLPFAIGQPCPRCGETMLEHEPLDLDHSTPLAEDRGSVGDRIVHASCNRSAGALAAA